MFVDRPAPIPALLACAPLALLLAALFAHAGEPEAGPGRDEQAIRALLEDEPPSEYRLFALSIGTTERAWRNLFIADPELPRRIEVSFSFFALLGHERVILIDCGFVSQRKVEKWRISGYRDPISALEEIGVEAAEVTDVVVTHSHWDHIGGLGRFENARIWIHKKELRGLRRGRDGRLPRPLRVAKREERLRVTRSLEIVAPSIAVVPVGLHTPGFQYVVVERTDGIWVLASDIAPLWANFQRNQASGQSPKRRTLAVQATMLGLVDGDLSRIVPGHEPGLFTEQRTVELRPGGDQVEPPSSPSSR